MSAVPLPEQMQSVTYFDVAQQRRLDADDTEAFSAVTGILLFILTGGLLLGIVSVIAIMAMS